MERRSLLSKLALLLTMVLLVWTVAGCTPSRDASLFSPPDDVFKVSMDVNPSMELTIVEGLVSAVKAYNDDGSAVLMDAEVVGLSGEEAVAAIVAEMVQKGYIATSEIQPYLLITVAEDASMDPAAADALMTSLGAAADTALVQAELGCAVRSTTVSLETTQASEALGLSVGRYLLFRVIAQEKGISIEDVILTYGHLTIGEIMEMFDGAESAFMNQEGDTESGENPEEVGEEDAGDEELIGEEDPIDEEDLDELTPEQREALQPLFEQLKADMKVARETFHASFKQIKEAYKNGLESLGKPGKGGVTEEMKAQRTSLRETMLADRKAAIVGRKDAVMAARAAFLQAALELGIPEELLKDFTEDVDEEATETDEESDDETDGVEAEEDESEESEDPEDPEDVESEDESEDPEDPEDVESEDESGDDEEGLEETDTNNVPLQSGTPEKIKTKGDRSKGKK
jgi:hypothetical protein